MNKKLIEFFRTPKGEEILAMLVKECRYKDSTKLTFDSNKDLLIQGEINFVQKLLLGVEKSKKNVAELIIKQYED